MSKKIIVLFVILIVILVAIGVSYIIKNKNIAMEPSVKIISPNGGEIIYRDSSGHSNYKASWLISGIENPENYYVKIFLIRGGARGETVLGNISNENVPATASPYNWVGIGVGDYLDNGGNLKSVLDDANNFKSTRNDRDYKIKVELFRTGKSAPVAEDQSDDYFYINFIPD